MATTHLIPTNKYQGKTIAETMAESFGYGKDPCKTENGKFISSYECDPKSADTEFLLSKARYTAITDRRQKEDEDILFYQIRQSFLPGEITPEEANKLSYETAMRWTKGKHAFLVTTHTDRKHIHSHIYYNSTSLDCTRKFRNFKFSSFALRRLSDRLCIENGLSHIKEPKQRSKGDFKHYGEWLGIKKSPSFQARLKAQIEKCLVEKPKSFNDFLQSMTAAGYEVKHVRGGGISFKVPGQDRFTHLHAKTLGEGYDLQDIQAIIRGQDYSKKRPTSGISLVVDIQERMSAGKGPAYEQWAKVFNLKQMAHAFQYLQENNLLDFEELAKKTAEATDRFHTLDGQIKSVDNDLKANSELRTATVNYAKTRPIFNDYKAKKYSKKYLAEHEDDIQLYRATCDKISHLVNGGKLPKMDSLKDEFNRLKIEKSTTFVEYKEAKKDMQELVTIKANVEHLLSVTDNVKNKEMER